jgi:FAD/FMN-containing dehydrogenase
VASQETYRQLREEIERIVGPQNVVQNVPVPEVHDMVFFYGEKEQKPEFFVLPTSSQQVSEIMKLANENVVNVVPWGGGTDRYPGAVTAPKGSIVLCTQKMTRIIDLDETDQIAVVQAGITVQALNRELRKRNLWWPHDPESKDNATAGGSIAINGIGTYFCKYGSARDMTLGLTIVLPDGRVIKVGRRVAHSITGYDLVRLFTGSEGTLGVIVEATIRLDRIPEERGFSIIRFKTIEDATKACSNLLDSGVRPEVLFVEDSERFRYNVTASDPLAESSTISTLQGMGAVVMVSVAGSKGYVGPNSSIVQTFLTQSGGQLVMEERLKKAWWKTKTSLTFEIPQNLKGEGIATKIGVVDVAIPLGTVSWWNERYRESMDRYRLFPGGLRVYITPNHDAILSAVVLFNELDQNETRKYLSWVEELSKLAVDIGGTMTSNLGVGAKLVGLVDYELNEVGTLAKDFKKLIDPHNIMNRGKKLSASNVQQPELAST